MGEDDGSLTSDQSRGRLETVETTLDSLETNVEQLDQILTDALSRGPRPMSDCPV